MGNKRFGGPKYANGNHKSQQKAYNRTKHGLKIRVAANKADQETKKNGTGKKGDGKDNAHYPGSNRSRLMSAHRNRGTERRKPRTA
tara:strand:+ start:1702 stop:1959 length:258 start_codon:yes stop_codon:yes gene_type:complete